MRKQLHTMARHAVTSRGAKRLSPMILAAGVAASIVLALSFSGTFAAFTASIRNDTNTATSGTVGMQETSGSQTCNSATTGTVTCSSINKYGGDQKLIPGASATTAVSIKNTGNATPKTFTLKPEACASTVVGGSAASTPSLCDKLNVVITYGAGNTQLFSGTASALYTANGTTPLSIPAPAANATTAFTFTVTLDPSADNTYQGLQASQPLNWAFSS
jgi:hypothetical protein